MKVKLNSLIIAIDWKFLSGWFILYFDICYPLPLETYSQDNRKHNINLEIVNPDTFSHSYIKHPPSALYYVCGAQSLWLIK